MKKYYLHDESGQQGPLDIEELKIKNITIETPIWYEGLSDWTTADNVVELKDLFLKTTPPPFISQKTTPPASKEKDSRIKTPVWQPGKKKSKITRVIFIFLGSIFLLYIFFAIAKEISSQRNAGNNSGVNTYEEKVLSVEQIERSQPSNFLSASGNYNQNFLGNKIKVHGIITNSATVANYKDAVVRVTYFSSTKTALANKDYIIYKNFPPHSTTNFELKIDNYKDVSTIGWDVLNATPN